MEKTGIPITIYAESTPNPATMKFVANKILHSGKSLEYLSPEETKSSPLAAKLFDFPFIKGVFISNNFITLTKAGQVDWNDVIFELREFIRDYLSNGKPILLGDKDEKPKPGKQIKNNTEPSEIDKRIIGVLDEYVRPAVEQDGGNIVFDSFEDGQVHLVMQGACSGCPSAMMTLKTGIEGLLKRMVPEVEEVVAVNG